MLDSKCFRTGIWLLLIFLIIFVGQQVSFIFHPLVVLVKTLFFPLFLSGILYFLLRPIVNLLDKYNVPRSLSILFIYLSILGVLLVLAATLGPILHQQFTELVKAMPRLVNDIQYQLLTFQQSELASRLELWEGFSIEELAERLSHFAGEIFLTAGTNIIHYLSRIANIFFILIAIPFILFFLLRDGHRFNTAFLQRVPPAYRQEAQRVLQKMDDALGSYIQSIAIVSLCVGVLVYIGYQIIGLQYSLIFAIVAALTNIIPFLGPILGTIPAMIIGFIQSPFMALQVIIIAIVAQQVESNLITPNVIGKKLSIHPLAIILLIMVAARFAGLLGIILAVPVFVIMRIVAIYMYELISSARTKS